MNVRRYLFRLALAGLLAVPGFNSLAAPFVPVNATYSGLFYEPEDTWRNSSGTFMLRSTTKGTYSGSLQVGASRYSFSGRFNSEGRGSYNIPRRWREPLWLEFQVTPEDPDIIYGTISDGTWTADLYADRSVFDGRNNVSPDWGQYTMITQPGEISADYPGGYGYATITIDKTGRLRCAGSLADGTKFSQSTTVSKNGHWPLFVPVYRGQGSLFGWLKFNTSEGEDLTGEVTWIKPEAPWDLRYPDGFAVIVGCQGSRYARPPRGTPILDLTTASIEFAGGGLDRAITNQIVLDSNNRIANFSGNRLSLSFSTTDGTFSGRVQHPVTWAWLPFRGVVLRNSNTAHGYFLNWAEAGYVWLEER
jgi:hypothetical protein